LTSGDISYNYGPGDGTQYDFEKAKINRGLNSTLMENLGYILSEAPIFFLILWFAVRLVQYRRYRRNQPIHTNEDRQMLSRSVKTNFASPVFRLKMARAILAVTAAIYIEMLILAPFGAAILTGALLLTSAAIVRRIVLLGS